MPFNLPINFPFNWLVPEMLLWVNVLSTWFMIGLIWFVQLVHYPLLDRVGADAFPVYEKAHKSYTSLIVGPPMLLEVASTCLLVWHPPSRLMPDDALWLGLYLLAGIWLLTAVASIPCHDTLSRGFDAKAYRWLVASNWGRTLLWTARGGIMAVYLHQFYTVNLLGQIKP